MSLEEMIISITPEVYQRLATAVEIGKWADGVPLTPEQKEHSLQLVLLWQSRNNITSQHMSIGRDGLIVNKSKQELKNDFGIFNEEVIRLEIQ